MKPIKLYKDLSVPLYIGETDIKRGVSPTPPAPITYLTQWKIVGNSEVHGNEIWSCGEYNPTDGKYHILVQPQGGSIADIALDEPLRMVEEVADTIEFPSDTEGKALVTRSFSSFDMSNKSYTKVTTPTIYFRTATPGINYPSAKVLCAVYPFYPYTIPLERIHLGLRVGINIAYIYFIDDNQAELNVDEFKNANAGIEVIYELATPTTELVDAPQIQEAESYSCVISQGAKAVSWSEFLYTLNYLLTDSENNLLVDSENYQLTVQS